MLARPMLLLGVLASAMWGVSARAQETFDYAVERFEVDGNVNGPLDGVPDVADDFDDGVMGPAFRSYVGTSSESGGALHLQSPGFLAGIVGVTPVRFETSAAIANGVLLQAGLGDGVLRATLPPQAVGPNDAVNFFLGWSDGTSLHYGGVSFANLNRSLGDLFSPAVPPGPSIFSHLEELGFPDNRILSLEPRAVDPLAVTGPVVLELRYDDTARTLTPRYSLDGGASFAPALAPLPIQATTWSTIYVYLAGVAYQGDCPAGVDIRTARLRNLGVAGRSRATLRLKMPKWIGYRAMRIRLSDQGAGGTVLFDAQLPDTLPSTPHCDPRDGWFPSGGLGYRYKNVSNALPPDCLPGSAQGLQKYQTRWTGTADVQVKIKNGSLPIVVGPLRMEVYDGTGPANSCDGFVGAASCVVAGASATCTAAP